MSGWPSYDRADDERLARSLAAGDPSALIQVMDRYAARLYDYCHALLRDQDQAAGALHDALIAAYAHVPVLREPDRFRGWLYALVRGECTRRLRDPDRPAGRHEAPEAEDGFLDDAELARRQETRRLVHSALSGLRGREREALDLMLRHGLDTFEVGGVLGLGAQEASDLTGAAQARLDEAIAALHIARTGRGDCPGIAAIADEGGRPVPPPVVRKLVQHVEMCPACDSRRGRAVPAARLLQVLPVAMMPNDLRGHVMATATDAALAADMAHIAHRAEPLDEWGWPVVADRASTRDASERRSSRALWPALAAAAAVIVIVAGAFYVMSGSSPSGGTSAQGPSGGASVLDPSSPPDSEEPLDSPTPTESDTPTPTPTTTSATPTPTRTRKPESTSSKPRPTTQKPVTGTLSVGSCTINPPENSCQLPVRAVGGTVRWRATGATNGFAASGGGTLAAGRTAYAQVSGSCDQPGTSGTVSFSPSGVGSVTCGPPSGGGGNPQNGG
ncbi:RNA polymerase sigma factor [Actinomadura latina]|uniref:Sigma-70 family RNA polymerase sigma factor n=1 Tax=Actinomadura latina TaxID=163603 RepID=A0A846YWC9_9ACTN|nr:sigma-70 family RNA polymerase sigma factor [Actinomadura latina]NKZ02914.1 sigma-70 family RNA polymerase sigma factor [Actinomadura latina]